MTIFTTPLSLSASLRRIARRGRPPQASDAPLETPYTAPAGVPTAYRLLSYRLAENALADPVLTAAALLQAMEFVFVVPRTALFPDCYPHGLAAFGERPPSSDSSDALSLSAFEAAVARDGFFVERAYAERTPSLKQVIPYSIIVCDERVLLFQRLATGGEKRLHGKSSIGIGGHINPEDLDDAKPGDAAQRSSSGDKKSVRSPIAAGTRREISEELDVRGTYAVRSVGLLNDDSNPVGAVHVGVVQVVYVDGSVEIRERDQLEGRLVTVDELQTLLEGGANFETWSRLLVPRLDELLKLPLTAHP